MLVLCWCGNVQAANVLRIYNDVPSSVTAPSNVFIQLQYAAASIKPALTNFEVVYPFTTTTNVWTLIVTNITAGNLRYGLDPSHTMEAYSKTGAPDVHKMYNGLFEFSLLTGDVGYWDISNVDWVGMLCGVRCITGGHPHATWQIGYNKKSSELIGMITNLYQFDAAQAANVMMTSNVWSNTWIKLMAPNIQHDEYAYSPSGKSNLVDYMYRLQSNGVPIVLKANRPSNDPAHFNGPNPIHWTNRIAALNNNPAVFIGRFHSATQLMVNPMLPGPGQTNQIVLVLTNDACKTEIYYSVDGVNPATIYRNDSDAGLWVRYCTDTNANTWVWLMTNRHLNCVSTTNPSLFEDWIASLANKLCYSLNAGLIPTNSNPTQVFTFSGDAALVHSETNTWQSPPYQVNMYNNTIVQNSDSYGMGYSDGNPFGGEKVVVQTKNDGAVVELHLLAPDADPSEYYSGNAGGFHTITATAGANGTMTPAGAVSVGSGSNQAFVIVASNFYRIAAVTTNSAPIAHAFGNNDVIYTQTWQNVQADGAIASTFTAQLVTNTPVSVPKTWLHQYYPTTNDYENASLSDTDDDRMEAWQEYVAGTNPTNALSVFALQTLNPGESSNYAITVATEPQRDYTIYFSDGLTGNTAWNGFASPLVGKWSETSEVSTSHTFTDDYSANTTGGEPTNGFRAYGVGVTVPAP
ncbi:MAG TPA: hypothetical protein DCZ95_20090 [Verrucomicrobia bacterium]|nr:MAG: hypothetical protein A2X46_02935 [Lentisphaerae bacterium GWF2_57_35]HBA86387.1 hypothetical protein [Verrucomicrobiota bacterium]